MDDDFHVPVMVSEVLGFLKVKRGGVYVDCTVGGGGHARAILECGGTVIGLDRDPEAVSYAQARLSDYADRFEVHVARFSGVDRIAGEKAGAVDGVLMDLGVSSRMIDNSSRGFSYKRDGPLLMDMGGSEVTAFDIVNTKSESDLAFIFRRYGEERQSRRIARALAAARRKHPINSTRELAEIVEKTVGGPMPQKSKARIFQALRIYINDELNELERGLEGAVSILRPGGRLCVISYHSLEDRIVKQFLKKMENPCVCPPDLPLCMCGLKPVLKIVTLKPVRASEDEIRVNTRSRSALMRAAEKCEERLAS